MAGRVEAVCLNYKKELTKFPHGSVAVGEFGIVGDRHSGLFRKNKDGEEKVNKRQVSIVAKEVVEELNEELGIVIPPGGLGENILVSGLGDLSELDPGDILEFENGVELLITAQNDPCAKINTYHKLVVKRIYGKRGVVANVMETGIINEGEEVNVVKRSEYVERVETPQMSKEDRIAESILKQVDLGDLSSFPGEAPSEQTREEPADDEGGEDYSFGMVETLNSFVHRKIARFLLGNRPENGNLLTKDKLQTLVRVLRAENDWMIIAEDINRNDLMISVFSVVSGKSFDERARTLPLNERSGIFFKTASVRSVKLGVIKNNSSGEEEVRVAKILLNNGGSIVIYSDGKVRAFII